MCALIEPVKSKGAVAVNSFKNLFGLSFPVLALSGVAMAAAEGGAGANAAGAPAVSGTPWLWWFAPIFAITALGFAWYFYKKMMEAPQGTEKMIQIAHHAATDLLFRKMPWVEKEHARQTSARPGGGPS